MSASAPAPQTEALALEPLASLPVEGEIGEHRGVLTVGEIWTYLGVLAGLIVLNVPTLGADSWRFRPGAVEPDGALAPLVHMARERWDPDLLRTAGLLAGVLVAVYALFAARAAARRLGPLLALSVAVLGLLVLPAVLLQAGLRDATAPWFFTNDSTYQIELAGAAVAEGDNPYGYDYGGSGLERFYNLDGTVGRTHVAEEHFAYFPGSALAASVWRLLPSPWDDFRLLVALATLATFFAVLAFRVPLVWRLALGALLVANPLVIRTAWFGNADAPSILFLVLAFAFVSRSRYTAGAVFLAVAVLLKQFALVALPFLAVIVLLRATRRARLEAGAAFTAVVAAGLLPFVIADPAAFWADTVQYGAETYRIVGYGLAALLVRAGLLESRTGAYPFLPLMLLVWLPATIVLLREQIRSRESWMGAAGFTLSIFLLIFLGRAFHPTYLLWPLAGIVIAGLLAGSPRLLSIPVAAPSRPEAAPTRLRRDRPSRGRRVSHRE